MLTVEKLRKIANEAFDNDEWVCFKSNDIFTITKFVSEEEIEYLLNQMMDMVDEDEEATIADCEDGTIYTDADHAKDWNYFKNTMGI